MDLEDVLFADASFTPTIPGFTTEHSYFGSPRNAHKPTPVSGTPVHELRARANAVRAALTSNLPQPPAIDASLTSRERDIALEAEREF